MQEIFNAREGFSEGPSSSEKIRTLTERCASLYEKATINMAMYLGDMKKHDEEDDPSPRAQKFLECSYAKMAEMYRAFATRARLQGDEEMRCTYHILAEDFTEKAAETKKNLLDYLSGML